jgi:hypothetical protein
MGPRVILCTIVAALVAATLGIGGVLAQTVTERDKDRLQQADIERLQETSSRAVTVELSPSGAVRFADFRVVSAPAPDGDNLPRAAAFLNDYRGLLRLDDPASQLRFIRRSPDGFHIFFRRAHHGIPVFAAELGVHLDDANVTGLGGNYVPDVGVSSSPTLAREEAIRTSLASGAPGARQVGEPELQ